MWSTMPTLDEPPKKSRLLVFNIDHDFILVLFRTEKTDETILNKVPAVYLCVCAMIHDV